MTQLLCWQCGESLDDVPRPISRQATCSACFNELHCCRLCRHYDAANTSRCHEDRADPPLQKDNANFCDFFVPHALPLERIGAHARARQRSSSKADLAALFGDKAFGDTNTSTDRSADTEVNNPASQESGAAATPEEIAKRKLDDLFS